MNISIIIPAYNAARTIAKTLESVCNQTYSNWEAIVIDDGSSDETIDLVTSFTKRMAQIRVVSQPHLGVSTARNKGISLARFDWLLFLDSDDWISPLHLEKLSNALLANPNLDAVYCGHAYITSNGKLREKKVLASGDLFADFGRASLFAIHTCIVRRSLVEAVGGFDASFRTCQDWDLWQRIARTGAHFGTIDETLAYYYLRPDSSSVNGLQFLKDGLRVITQACSPDPRVPNPHPKHAAGLPSDLLSDYKFYFACWCISLALGQGHHIQPLLEMLKDERAPGLEAYHAASGIFEALPRAKGRLPDFWVENWATLEQQLDEFLIALEQQTQANGLARRIRVNLERMILKQGLDLWPLSIGAIQSVRIEITQSLSDLQLAPTIERLQVAVEYNGRDIGILELPVCDGFVPASVLADAIAAEFAWPILGQFFEHTIYPYLQFKPEPNGLSLWREGLLLASGLAETASPSWSQLHDRIGWTIFLQEIWGRPEWPIQTFYDEEAAMSEAGPYHISKDRIVIEISEELPTINCSNQTLEVILAVGGAALGVITVPVQQNIVRPQKLRVALTLASAFELCQLVVREALVGQPLTGPGTLCTRLAARAQARQKEIDPVPEEIKELILKIGGLSPEMTSLFSVTPSAISVLKQIASSGKSSIILGRRNPQEIGTSASRRAALPAAAVKAVVDAASGANEPVIYYPNFTNRPEQILYLPDLILNRLQDGPARVNNNQKIKLARSANEETHRQVAHQSSFTHQLPILMYHRIAPTGSPVMARYRVTPANFEAQLDHLRRASFYSVSLEEWKLAMATKRSLPGRAVLLTIDDGYLDFAEYAWPLLKRYGFSATVFLVADEIGKSNRWAHVWGETQPLLSWKEIHQLQNEGVEFGSHSASHPRLTSLSPKQIVDEAARSRAILEHELETPVRAFAYPYGDVDPIVQHLVGACSYTFGLSCRPEPSRFHDSLLALPRIEITGSDDLSTFIAKLEATF